MLEFSPPCSTQERPASAGRFHWLLQAFRGELEPLPMRRQAAVRQSAERSELSSSSAPTSSSERIPPPPSVFERLLRVVTDHHLKHVSRLGLTEFVDSVSDNLAGVLAVIDCLCGCAQGSHIPLHVGTDLVLGGHRFNPQSFLLSP
jgi:hypothetical protein